MAGGFTRRDAATTKGTVMPETVTVEPGTTETIPEGATPEADELGEAGKKAIAVERKARREAEKAAAELADRLKAIEDKDKTEAQRQQEALEAAKAELEALTTAKTRAEVAADKAVPVALLAGPASNSAEDIAKYADALIAFRGKTGTSRFHVPGEGTSPAATKPTDADFIRRLFKRDE